MAASPVMIKGEVRGEKEAAEPQQERLELRQDSPAAADWSTDRVSTVLVKIHRSLLFKSSHQHGEWWRLCKAALCMSLTPAEEWATAPRSEQAPSYTPALYGISLPTRQPRPRRVVAATRARHACPRRCLPLLVVFPRKVIVCSGRMSPSASRFQSSWTRLWNAFPRLRALGSPMAVSGRQHPYLIGLPVPPYCHSPLASIRSASSTASFSSRSNPSSSSWGEFSTHTSGATP